MKILRNEEQCEFPPHPPSGSGCRIKHYKFKVLMLKGLMQRLAREGGVFRKTLDIPS